MRKLEIYNEDIYPKNVIVSGAGRSGKTSLCKLWASTKGVEWLEEPNSLIIISYALLMNNNNKSTGIDRETCESLWGLNLREHINDIVLGRDGLNFRPGDLSSVWEFKGVSEIMERLHVLKTRDDAAEYIRRNNMVFLVDIPELISPLSKLADKKFNSSMITLVRNPGEVANDVVNKGWFTDNNLTNPLHGNNYTYLYEYNGIKYRLPFWLKEDDAEVFIKSSDYDRGLIYWISIAEDVCDNISGIDRIIQYEDLVKKPLDIVEQLCVEYGGRVTDITKGLCNQIMDREINIHCVTNSENNLSEEMKERMRVCCKCWNYI